MGTSELSTLLFKERELLELLHFKLEEQHLLLVAGKTQWIALGVREIEKVLEKVHSASLERALVAQQVALALGLAPDSQLSRIAEATPEAAWQEILTSHLKALQQTTIEIARLREANDTYLRAAFRSTQETLAALGEDSSLYGPTGTPNESGSTARILDTNL